MLKHCLGTGLKREHGKSSALEGSQELECFLKQIEEEILKQSINETKNNNKERECKFI
jgi:hypothetical protein